jgi:hypothetical protein
MFTFISELSLTSATSLISRNYNSLTQLKSRSKICYHRRSVGQSALVSRTHLEPRPHLYYCQTVARELLMWGDFSDERTGLSFTTAVGPRQRSHSSVRVPHNSWPYTWNTANVVGFEVLTAVVIMNSIFWDITMCIPFKVDWRFGGICLLHFQSRRISRALLSTRFPTGFLPSLFFDSEDGDMFLQNVDF